MAGFHIERYLIYF